MFCLFLMFSVFLLAWILPKKNHYCICALLILELPYRHNFTREEGSLCLSIIVFWSEYKKDIFKAQFDPIWKKKSPCRWNTHKETRLLIEEYPEHFRKRGSMYSPGMDDVSSKEMNVLHVVASCRTYWINFGKSFSVQAEAISRRRMPLDTCLGTESSSLLVNLSSNSLL